MLALTFTISSLFTMCFSMLIRSQRGIICTTECNEGQMCNDDECEPCPNGYYMNEPGHRQIYCYKWTEKPTYNAIILKNGTAKTDVVWVCADGYMKKEFAAGGSWECIKITTTTIATTTTTETPVSSSSTSSPSDTTFKTDNPYKSQESKKNNVAAIVISVLVVCIIVIFVVIYCWRKTIIKKKKETNNDPELGQLYNKIMEVIGIEKCSQLLLHLTNPINANIISTVECIEFFRKWERNCREHNPDFNHSEDIVRALETLGYILPGTNLTDPAVVIESLNKAEKLNNEFRKFCLVLCTELDERERSAPLSPLYLEGWNCPRVRGGRSRTMSELYPARTADWSARSLSSEERSMYVNAPSGRVRFMVSVERVD
ncbi:hypothetical protein Btru_054458 [Bulinus truncatus]|nr:hypothetical protein Btru_054458 [Bulinus truncatus]